MDDNSFSIMQFYGVEAAVFNLKCAAGSSWIHFGLASSITTATSIINFAQPQWSIIFGKLNEGMYGELGFKINAI